MLLVKEIKYYCEIAYTVNKICILHRSVFRLGFYKVAIMACLYFRGLSDVQKGRHRQQLDQRLLCYFLKVSCNFYYTMSRLEYDRNNISCQN